MNNNKGLIMPAGDAQPEHPTAESTAAGTKKPAKLRKRHTAMPAKAARETRSENAQGRETAEPSRAAGDHRDSRSEEVRAGQRGFF